MKNPHIALAALVFLAAGDAWAGVDVELDLNARVKVTHDPEFEVGRFRFQATQGTSLNIVVAGVGRRSQLDLQLRLCDPDDALVDIAGSATRFVDRDKRVIVRGLVAQKTGEYELEVSASGTGPYALRLKGNPQRVWRDGAEDLDAAGATAFDFAAPAGARVILRATTPRGSAATPRFTDFLEGDLSTAGRATTRAHTVPVAPLSTGDSGDLTVGLRNDAGDAGDVTFVAIVRPARMRLQNLDLRSGRLGAASGEEAAKSATVDELGGVVEIDDPSNDADGAGVNVPAGALPIPTRITVTSAADLPPEADQQAGGPAIEFGPDGLEFVNEATITLPLDVSALPVGTQPGDILVIKVESDGTRTTIVPDSVDLVGGTATVPITSFSTYQTNVPIGAPTLQGREFWSLRFGATVAEDFRGGADSRNRSFFREVGTVLVPGAEFEPRGVDIAVDASTYSFFHSDEAAGVSFLGESPAPGNGSWRYIAPGRITIDQSLDEGPRVYAVAEDGSALVHAPTDDSDGANDVALEILLERSRNPPSLASVAGSYWVGSVSFDYFDPSSAGPEPIELIGARSFGSLTLTAAGTFSASFTDRFKEFRGLTRSFESGRAGGRARGTISVPTGEVFYPGAIELRPNGPDAPITHLFPSRDRNVLLGLEDSFGGFTVFVAVRKSGGLNASEVDDTYAAAGVGIQGLNTYTISTSFGPAEVADFGAFGGIGDVVLAGGEISLADSVELELFRDEGLPNGVRVNMLGPTTGSAVPRTLTRSGRLSFTRDGDRLLGAVSPDGTFGFILEDPAVPSDVFRIDVFVSPSDFESQQP